MTFYRCSSTLLKELQVGLWQRGVSNMQHMSKDPSFEKDDGDVY